MHPRQAALLNQSADLTEKLAAKPPGTVLWEYTDPDGREFYLKERITTVKSPWTGKSFTAKPKKFTPAQVGQEMRDEKNEATSKGKTQKSAGHEQGLWDALTPIADNIIGGAITKTAFSVAPLSSDAIKGIFRECKTAADTSAKIREITRSGEAYVNEAGEFFQTLAFALGCHKNMLVAMASNDTQEAAHQSKMVATSLARLHVHGI